MWQSENKRNLFFVDTEVSVSTGKVNDIGSLSEDGNMFHSASMPEFMRFVASAEFVCGHNLIHHDLKYLWGEKEHYPFELIDTLYLSPLLFPKKPYHKLLKDDKLQVDELNNPLNDCEKARTLLYDEINAFHALPPIQQQIYYSLLNQVREFQGFFRLIGYVSSTEGVVEKIKLLFGNCLCVHKSISSLVEKYPVELAYSLALIGTEDFASLTPPWLLRNYPKIERTIKYLCNTPCQEGCGYCKSKLDIYAGLKQIFGYSEFRTFDGEPLQERAVQEAVDGNSLLTIFPTGGGKSLTFQLPAILAGRAMHGLTVVISPLQSLMKDQVDNLMERGISDAVSINGLLDPISRADAIRRVEDGSATILYISPEMLRSKTVERLLLSRNVVRFVIDEAHCFSAWGQDFRVDYLYIGEFIKRLQEMKGGANQIPVSCFTATAKQKVISDICDYFKRTLDLHLKKFATEAQRKNLKYSVIHADTEDDKYGQLRGLLEEYRCPAIIYVSRTKKTSDLAKKLTNDGFPTLPYHGKMDPNDKIRNQNAFINNEVRCIVATSAFGMGVDKKDVGLVVHYEISDSLENYVQEAGRAGRDPNIEASCYVLYNDNDLDKHFILLNHTKLSISEIQQVWSAIKSFTKQRKTIACSALEIARAAGWDDTLPDIETRVRSSIAALESAGYVKRGNNVPHVYATGIMVKNMDEARKRITDSSLFDEAGRTQAIRIIKSLISKRTASTLAADGEDAESRVDYLADVLGMTKESVIQAVNRMRQEGILADSMDMEVYIDSSDTENRSNTLFSNFSKLERFLLDEIPEEGLDTSYKKLNDKAVNLKLKSTVKNLRTLLYFLTLRKLIKKEEHVSGDILKLKLSIHREFLLTKYEERMRICRFLISEFYKMDAERQKSSEKRPILFSLTGMLAKYQKAISTDMFSQSKTVALEEVEEALLYLSKIGALRLDGGFMVIYNAMEIKRLAESKIRYKQDDYRLLDEFYKQKVRQVHIVGEFANLMVRDYSAALRYVHDYFEMDFRAFIKKYFEGSRAQEIEKNITQTKYRQLFGELSERQREIINDKSSKYIVVAAGPGSGKTKVLVHKLASLLLMEDVKHEQLLMLTFSRAAATEFKRRLISLIGNAAYFVEIKTFHSYCFDLIGKVGNLEESQNVVATAVRMIEQGEVEPGRINKSVLVIDEAQDMDENEFSLVQALMKNNEEMRVIAVGDDDQNIYAFRGSDSKYLRMMIEEMNATKYEMTENYRSVKPIVDISNALALQMSARMKDSPIVSKSAKEGTLVVCEYLYKNMELPLVQQLKENYKKESTCVLTRTNEEAFSIVCLLSRYGLKAQLIQSMDKLRFYNLADVRYFLKLIDSDLKSPIISEERWEWAKNRTLEKYGRSETGEMLQGFFSDFEQVNRVKYRSDLEDFVFESNVEDFLQGGDSVILVSTIHKSKGREFDSVYMLLSDERSAIDDEGLRNIYVGLTRAKRNLFIHTNSKLFYPYRQLCTEYRLDTQKYDEPEEIVLQLSYKEVYLDYFKGKKSEILKLRSGDNLLFYDNKLLTLSGLSVASLSEKAKKKLAEVVAKGYQVHSAKVRFVVAWKPKDEQAEQEELAVLLIDLLLRRGDR